MGGKERKWYERPVRVLQFNIEDRYGVAVRAIDGRKLVDLAASIGANVLVIFARDPWGRSFYRDTRVNIVHPKMRGDIVKEAVAEGRRRGVRVVVMVGHTANKLLYMKHSDWAQVNHRGETILLEHVPFSEEGYDPEWPQLCINSPFIDHVRREIEEVLELGVDGVFLDSFRYQPDIERACYCRWCRERFRSEHGFDMPEEARWGDSRWKTLWNWRYSVVAEKIRELSMVVREKGRGRDIVFMYNSHPAGWAGRTNRVVEITRDSVDVVFAECSEVDHQPPGFITEMVKLTRAMSGGKPVWASRNYFHLYRTVSPTTKLAIKQGLREAVIGGGSPWLLVFSASFIQDPSALDAAKEVFEEHRRIEEYIDGAEPIRYAGIVVSNTTRDFYGREHPEDYVDETRGFYYALVHSHIPVDYISEIDASRASVLGRYRVLVLANTVCTRDPLVSAIRSYVSGGGGVIATYQSTLCDEECVSAGEFRLAHVLGVSLKGVLETPWSYIVPVERGHRVFEGVGAAPILWGDMSYDFTSSRTARSLGSHVLIEPLEGSSVLGVIGLPVGSWGYEYTLGRSPPPFSAETRSPAIVENRWGSGTSIYFSGQLGRHYWRTGLPVYRRLIVNAIHYIGGEPEVSAEAPETVAVEAFRQGERIIVHLLNHTYNQRILSIGIGRTRQPLPAYSGPAAHPPREVVPITGIRVRARVSGAGGYRVFSPVTGREFKHSIAGNTIVVEDISLGEYEAIVIEPRS